MEAIERMKTAFLESTKDIKYLWTKEYLIPCIISSMKRFYCTDIPKEVITRYVHLVFTCMYDI